METNDLGPHTRYKMPCLDEAPLTEHLLPQTPGAREKTLPLTHPFRSALWPPKIPRIQTVAATFLRCGQDLQGFFFPINKLSITKGQQSQKLYLISKEPLLISLLYLFSYSWSGKVESTGAQFQPKAVTLKQKGGGGGGTVKENKEVSSEKENVCVHMGMCASKQSLTH